MGPTIAVESVAVGTSIMLWSVLEMRRRPLSRLHHDDSAVTLGAALHLCSSESSSFFNRNELPVSGSFFDFALTVFVHRLTISVRVAAENDWLHRL
jgi:hypothetical protein